MCVKVRIICMGKGYVAKQLNPVGVCVCKVRYLQSFLMGKVVKRKEREEERRDLNGVGSQVDPPLHLHH